MSRRQKAGRPIKEAWGHVVLGIALLVGFAISLGGGISASDLISVRFTAQQAPRHHGGSREPFEYTLRANEFPCIFGVRAAGANAAGRSVLSEIQASDSLVVRVHRTRATDLSDAEKTIPVYAMQKNGRLLFDADAFQAAQSKINRRWGTFLLVLGSVLLFYGLGVRPLWGQVAVGAAGFAGGWILALMGAW